MIVCTRISVKNVRSVPDATIEPDLTGITSLHGPIGAGKSTILTALVWCLYGEVGGVPGLLSQSEMRRRDTTDPVEVEVEFTHAGSTLLAHRTLRQGKRGKETAYASLSIDGVKQPSISPTKLTQQIVQRTGLTGRAFVGAFFIAQGNLPSLAEGTPAEVQRLIEEQTGLAPLTKTIEQARATARDAQVRADAMPGSIDDVNAAQSELDTAQAAAADRWPQLEEAENKLSRAREREEEARTQHENLQQQSAAAHDAQVSAAQARRNLEHANGRLTALREEIRATGTREDEDRFVARGSALRSSADTVTATRAARDRQHANLAEARAAADRAAQALAATPQPDQDPAVLASDLETAKADQATARAEWTRLNKTTTTLREVSDHHKCPTCTQNLNDPGTLIADLTAQMEMVATRGKTIACRVIDLTEKVEHAQAMAATRREAHLAVEHTATARQQAEHAQAASQAAADEATGDLAELLHTPPGTRPEDLVAGAHEQMTRLTEQITATRRVKQLHEQASAAQATAAQAQATLTSTEDITAPDPETLAAAAGESTDARHALTGAHRDHSALKSEVDVLLERARAAEVARDQQQKVLDARADADTEADTKWHAHRMLVELRKELVAEYTATISDAATDLMAQVGGGAHIGVTIGADFVPRVVLSDGTTRTMRVLSGGEKMRAALCLRLGIAEQISGAGGEGMIFADEITASHDADTTTAVVEMMRALGRPMVVVAHADQVQQIATKVYRVTKPTEGQGATVSAAQITPPTLVGSGA